MVRFADSPALPGDSPGGACPRGGPHVPGLAEASGNTQEPGEDAAQCSGRSSKNHTGVSHPASRGQAPHDLLEGGLLFRCGVQKGEAALVSESALPAGQRRGPTTMLWTTRAASLSAFGLWPGPAQLQILGSANSMTIHMPDRSRPPGPPLGRLALRRCRLALTPGRPPQNGGPTPCRETAQGVPRRGRGAGYPCGAWVWRGVSGRPGRPGYVTVTTASTTKPRHILLCRQAVRPPRAHP
jgi:hypothetical protein